ncbi:metal-sulfur cluster assembly factor [Botryobacter ruber]|uniref:metal-sulfur cluster assembly factor n=1 Tax=Botryobacter ruber TaxID=2171629 RepID=UPI000E0B2900|nr:metal-sulfur cluster assembly factor [Botryobacter ruber]
MEAPTTETGNEVLETLKFIIDPEIGINIVDLGLVYKVSHEANRLHVELTLTTPGCPMSSTIVTAAEQILQNRFPELAVAVELVWVPMWTPERITEAGLLQMNSI